MTKEELLLRLSDIEWDDFEVKEASGGLPKSVWETVSAFSNTSGGWIILGVKEKRDENGSTYIVTGVPNVEKMEQEIISTLRSRTKFNSLISGKAKLYDIDGKKVLAFEIPLSPHRPIALKSNGDVYIRTGSGDALASDLEIDAIIRDSAFGSKSEMEVLNSGFDDINRESIASYRSYLRDYNRALSYPDLDDKEFCSKLNIVLASGKLSYGSLLMFGKRDSVLKAVPNFWIDYIEIPGESYGNAHQRYNYRMPEQDNIWESFQLIMRRLRNFVDAPYIEGPDIFGTEDNSQLFCLREGVVNFCAHTDYFAAAHPTIRVFSDRISMQNPGRFILDADEFRSRILSMPRNPSIIKFFRYPKLAENAGYGIEKILHWERLTGKPVIFHSDLLVSTVEYPISRQLGENNGENSGENNGKLGENIILEAIRKDVFISQPKLAELTGFSQRKVNRIIAALRDAGKIRRIGKTKGGHWEIIDSLNHH